jgi:glycogen debranching enzyme
MRFAEQTEVTPMTNNVRLISQSVGPADVLSDYEIEARTSLTDRGLRNLKHGDAFAVFDSYGDMGAIGDTAEGLFYRDTRFLSRFELRIEGKRPLLLSSAVHEDKAALSVELTNPDVRVDQNDALPRDTIFMRRTKFLWNGVCYERISIRNYASARRRLRLDVLFDADFRDLFEVRGAVRSRRGSRSTHVVGPDRAEFRYEGLDKIERRTAIRFTPVPRSLATNRATIEVDLGPYEKASVFVNVSCQEQGTNEAAKENDFFQAYRETRRMRRKVTANIATVESSNESFDEVVCRATSDVYTLITRNAFGLYPYAGIPWFNTIFGRDGIITAMLMLWVDASVARGVLRTLAATQATEFDPQSDAQPGKILHEMRLGEMANLKEVPFRRYYGTVDATPLFVMLAGMYLERTGDRQTILEIWPNIEAALRWVDDYGDKDGDSFVEYLRETESGLANQGWKDSHDAIFHANGVGAKGPIALCEVQGYVFAAKKFAAHIADSLGLKELAAKLSGQAEQLRINFEAAFWCEDLGTYALALDGEKRPCRVVASNAGHALFTGIAASDRARKVADTLLNSDGFSGWGIRTLSAGQARYNPMSYHNGSVWPHENALIAMGFARYGFKAEAARVFGGVFNAARCQELKRLPELFCGFMMQPHRGPTPYPVACAPQAWAATASFGLLGACLGLELSYDNDEIRFRNPVMPDFLGEVVIRNLRLGSSRADVRLHRYGNDVTANVLERYGTSKILIIK